MGVVEYLQQYGEAARVARQIKREYERELDMIDAIRSPMDGDGTHGSGISRTVESKATRLADKAAELSKAWDDAIRVRQEVYKAIRKVPGVAVCLSQVMGQGRSDCRLLGAAHDPAAQ